jgi:hypothetical protein
LTFQAYNTTLTIHSAFLYRRQKGSILWGLGDGVAQIVPRLSEGEEVSLDSYDLPRTGRACFFGGAIHAPTSHVHFNFLEWMTKRFAITGEFSIPIFKTVMEQFVYWSWISNSLYHGAMGAMQGHSGDQIYNRIADVLWETQKAQWVFWIRESTWALGLLLLFAILYLVLKLTRSSLLL